jgi:hypothetical protein
MPKSPVLTIPKLVRGTLQLGALSARNGQVKKNVWKCLGYEFVDREPDFGFLNRSALACSACKIGIFTPVRQETLSRIAEIGRGLIRCSEEHTTTRKRKSKENSFSEK